MKESHETIVWKYNGRIIYYINKERRLKIFWTSVLRKSLGIDKKGNIW